MESDALQAGFSDAELAALHQLRQLAGAQVGKMEAFLKELARISSQSADRDGVNRAGEFFCSAMPECFRHEAIPSPEYGNCHFFSHEVPDVVPLAMMGHLDTVIPDGFDTFEEKDGCLIGPGVADMKGGLVVMLWALRLLDTTGLLRQMSVRCLVNSDEEVNSPWSRSLVPHLRGSRAGFVFEMAGPSGEVVTRRIGITVFRLKTTGKAAHAGTGAKPKSSAVLELAHRILQLEALNSDSLLVNVGKVSGGRAYNFVPDQAEALLAIRYWEPGDEAKFFKECDRLLSTPGVPGCRVELDAISRRPPLQPDAAARDLFAFCQTVASQLGQKLTEEHRPGGSDAAFLQEAGIPTIDGWGPVGGSDFSPDEFIVIKTLAERAALVAACTWMFSMKYCLTPALENQ